MYNIYHITYGCAGCWFILVYARVCATNLIYLLTITTQKTTTTTCVAIARDYNKESVAGV